VDAEPVRQVYLEHDVPALSLELREAPDGSLSFEGIAHRFRTANDDPYEYCITIEADGVPALRRALGIAPDADAFDAVVRRSREIVKRGEHRWLSERQVPLELFKWAPWETVTDDY
jgi:hypothetical protein